MTVAEKYNLPKCPGCYYFSGDSDTDWDWSESGDYKIRKNHKPYKCLYNNQIIEKWEEVRCPLEK